MKRKLGILLPVCLLLALLLSACGGKEEIRFGAAGEGGPYYAYSMAVAKTVQADAGYAFDVKATAGSAANIRLLSEGYLQMAIAQSDVAADAWNGCGAFEGDARTGYSAVASLYTEYCQIVVRADSDILGVEDLYGKVVSVGEEESGTELNARQILECCGLGETSVQLRNDNYRQAAAALKSGEIDAFFVVAGAPTTAITDLSVNREFKLLAIDDEHYDILASKYGFYSKYPIVAGTYSNEEDVQTVAVKATYICREDLPEDVVYEFTKALFEKKDALVVAHNKFANIDLSYAQDDIGSVPFHAGAARYYNEVK